MKWSCLICTAVLSMLCLAVPASAQLQNPSFETGTLAGWNLLSGSITVAATMPFGGHLPTAGSRLAYAANSSGPADFVIYQQIPWSGSDAQALVDISTTADGVDTSEYAGIRIGIDRAGGANPSATTVVWSALTSHSIDQIWDVAAVAADGISSSAITVFVQSISDPYNNNGGWKIQVIDNVRVSALTAAPEAKNLSWDFGTLAHWYSHNAIDTVPANWFPGPYGHAIAPVTTSFNKNPAHGTHFIHLAESGANHKKGILLQRFQTDIGNGIPNAVRVELSFNRNTSGGMHWDQNVKLGIDPTGGVDPKAVSVNWSDRIDDFGVGGWATATHTVTGGFGSVATVFVENVSRWTIDNFLGLDHVRLFMDDVEYQEPVPTPTPMPSNANVWSTYR